MTAGASMTVPRTVRARYFNVYRLAAYLLVLYTLGHTIGAVIETPAFGPASDNVVAAMKSIHVVVQGSDRTWYGFYRGMGGMVSVFVVFSAFLTWRLGGMDSRERRLLAPVILALFLTWVAGTVLTWVYFFAAPILLSTAVVIFLGIGVIKDAGFSEPRV